MQSSLDGCFTAVITPFHADGSLDMDGLGSLLDFQLKGGITGIVVAGTTGEGPTLEHQEFVKVLARVLDTTRGRAVSIANTGANSTKKALELTTEAWELGAKAALLVDPYYNGPSSLEIRREYYEPIASALREMQLIPYLIPGRTGTQLAPEDLFMLVKEHPNVVAVKEATGSSENAATIRALCGGSFSILSGDDDKTYGLMSDPRIMGNGTISVISNIAPKAVGEMVSAALTGDTAKAALLATALKPLSDLVTVKTEEQVMGHGLMVKARNPVPAKTMAAVLGMPVGPCRRPLGLMTRAGLSKVVEGLKAVWRDNPSILEPVEEAFGVSVESRLASPGSLDGLSYESY